MPDVSATKFKSEFFKYLDRIEQGETFNIIRNKKKIATNVEENAPKKIIA